MIGIYLYKRDHHMLGNEMSELRACPVVHPNHYTCAILSVDWSREWIK